MDMSDKKRKIALAVALVLIIGAIIYLESVQAHRGGGGGNATQSINVPATSGDAGISASTTLALQTLAMADQKNGATPAVELTDPTGFVNTAPFKLSDLVGKKVILLDFWTYSCINCIRTVPYLNAWYAKYKDAGFVIVGVHTPEFDFEKDINNVQAATQKFGIQYPVVLDSNYGTWQAYNNLYWPHEYLIDIAGYVVHDQIGEGNYDKTEAEIQKLLDERSAILGTTTEMPATGTVVVAPSDLSGVQSPETYFGAARNQYLANGTSLTNGVQTLQMPSGVALNSLYLGGTWDFLDQYATNNTAGAKIVYRYNAGNVYFVASASSSVSVEVLQDGKPISSEDAGSDVHNGKITVHESRLYNVVKNAAGAGKHTLELIIDAPGLNAYTFTFG